MNQTRTKISLEHIQGCLMGVMIGDAMGMPVETMKHEEIMKLNDGRGITDFVAPIQRRIKETACLNAGDTTDDWQLTRAVAHSIIRSHGPLDIVDCAQEHVHELSQSTFGWGWTSQTAIEAIRDGKRNPLTDLVASAPPGKGCGNGVIMKIAPVAIAYTVLCGEDPENEYLWQQCRKLGCLTHPDIRASIAAYAVALMMNHVIMNPHSTIVAHGGTVLDNIIDLVAWVERREMVYVDLVSDRMRLIPGVIRSAKLLRVTVGCGCHAIDTAAFTIGTYLRNQQDFRAGVLEAVNAGGDTDTNASIVGALIGLNGGLNAIPSGWRSFDKRFEESLGIGTELARL